MRPSVNVKSRRYGGPRGAGGDWSGAFQMALRACRPGGAVIVPGGEYHFRTGGVVVPANVALIGNLVSPPHFRKVEKMPAGTATLVVDMPPDGPAPFDAPTESKPFITLAGHNATVKDFAIRYHQQDDPEDLQAYPWTIAASGGSSNAIDNVFLLNSYRGVDFSHGSSRHWIRDLTGQVLREGILIDQCTDPGRIQDVHFWPFWDSSTEGAMKFTAEHGVAMTLRGTDWQIVRDFFAFGHGTGIRFGESLFPDPRSGNFKPANGQLSGISLDSVGTGLDVRALKRQGVHVNGLNSAVGRFSDLYDTTCAILGWPQNTGTLAVQGMSVWGEYDTDLVVWNSPGGLILSNSVFGCSGKTAGDLNAITLLDGEADIFGNIFTANFRANVADRRPV